jgi:hypothetical protein
MMHARQLFLRLRLAGLMTGCAALTPIGAANAAPFFIPSLGTTTAPIEKSRLGSTLLVAPRLVGATTGLPTSLGSAALL